MAEPKSYTLSACGISDELKDATTFTVSEVASPIVSCPPKVRLPSIFAFPVISKEEPEMPATTILLPVPSAVRVASPLSSPICNVPNVVFTYGSPNANEPDFCAVVPRLNLSAI